MRKKLTMLLASLFLVLGTAWAQAPVDSPKEAITGLLNRIGGNGAAGKFEIVIDASLAENGKDVFIITSQNGKPCIKGNTQLSVATGINWYLNHYAHINLTWNNLTTDLSQVTLPVPGGEEKHVSNATYRYDFNTCTFSYSMAFWTWERWQQEIDWMALHGINAPLNLVGLEVVTRNFLEELGVSETDIDNYIAGPGFMAWFAMNNLEGWGSTINAKDVTMNGNPDWWYERQEALCKKMLQRMRELGMQPVIPGFSGQVPNCIVNYSIDGFDKVDVINSGSWAGGYTRPDIVKPDTESYRTLAAAYYKHLHNVMGVSELYSIDPFHEGGLPRWDSNRDGKINDSDSYITNAECYPPIMQELDNYYSKEETQTVREEYNALAEQPKWIIQYWQNIPQGGAFTEMKKAGYTNRFIGLDLFADNIYAGNAAKWRTNYYDTCPYVYCMLHNFGGRSGMHGRLETTMNGYFEALAKGNNCQGIGATPEGTETNPILYDMLFELPWMDPATRPSVDKWLEDYAYSRYGIQNSAALSALQNLKKSVWNCQRNQQGTSEAIILGRPRWTFGDAQRNDGTSLEGRSVSSWSVSSIYWDTQDVLLAADDLYSIKDLITSEDGRANFDYDFIEVVRQSMVDQASVLLPLIKAARNNGDTAEYERLYGMFLQLMLDLDEMLSYDENFKLERWTSLARNIANEATGTNDNDRNWLEWNARTQVTVWSNGNNGLNDYSNRCWAGLIKDFHYPRWKYFFENNGGVKDGNWFTSEKAWTVNFTDYDYSTVTIPGGKTATEKAAETFGNYFGRVRGATKNYIFPMGITTNATKCDVTPTVNRGQTVELPLIIGKNVTISSVWIDLNNDGAKGNGEALTANGNNVTIPADAKIGKTTAQVVYSDGTDITFNLALVEEISEERTVTAVAGANGSVAIEGTNELSITNAEAVKMTATANTGYNFEKWIDAQGNTVSNDNPYIYYGKGAATFTANFIQNKWGVVECALDKDDYTGEVKDEAAVMKDVSNNNQYIHNLTLSYYNREAETIYEPATAPTSIFTTIPQIVNVPQGASFTVEYDKGIGNNNFQHCYFRAYIDLNADGDFDDEGELLKEVGTKGDQNTAVCSNSINVLLPYTIPLGITHMRLRFDSAWNIGDGAKAKSVRPVYDLVINVTEGSDKAAHITVASNNDAWGTAKVWTEETPGWTASNEWDVSTGIYAQIKATKASDDVEFLGWYDQYGRLLTSELEYSMLAREDATYTARFRKALDIDGWQFEYRTEPGSEIITNKLANGVKPEAGKTYFIYAPTRPTNNGDYVNRYLYNNGGTLTLSTTESTAASYLWVCGIENGKYTFQNVGNPEKYLMHKGLSNSPYGFEMGTGTTCYEGITLQSVPGGDETRNLFFVINDDGSGFNHSTKTHNQSTEEFTTDFVFTEVSAPDVVIFTSVRQSGDHDLEIPETVEILGEQCKVVGFDNNLFNNNKDLWSISLPQTIEFLSSNTVFETSLNGNITPSTGSDGLDSSKSQLIDLGGYALDKNKAWTLNVSFKTEGKNSLYNQWGTILLSGGNNASNNQWFYLSANGNGYLRLPGFGSLYHNQYDANNFFYEHTNGKIATFTVSIANQGNGTAIVTVINSEGVSKSSAAVAFDPQGFTQLSSYMTKGVNITKLEITEGPIPNPFSGCSNLATIVVDDDCANYSVDNNGDLYNACQVLVCSPEGKGKTDAIRNLGTLVDNTKALMDAIAASIDPVGKATEIGLTTTQGNDYYIWCNNPHSESHDDGKGGVAALLDEDAGTYLHSNWDNNTKSTIHDYLQIDNIVNAEGLYDLYNFKIAGQQRGGDVGYDLPKNIEIYGSNNKTNWTPITTVEGLPKSAGATWNSSNLTLDVKYSSLKFIVKTYDNYNQTSSVSRPYFHMAKFDLFKLTSTVEVAAEYQELGGITNEEAANVYDHLVNALYAYNNGGTVAELEAAYNALAPLYSALNDKKNKVEYVRELNELIPAVDALIDAITVSTSTGTPVALALTTKQNADYYVSTNADQNTGGGDKDGAGIAGLVDGSVDTHFHSRWGGTAVDAPHHIKVDLGEGNEMSLFQFCYVANNGPDPIKFDVKGSNDGTNFDPIETITKDETADRATYTSKVFETSVPYRYLLFEVLDSYRYGFGSSFGNYKCFGMKEFDLFKLIEVAPGYNTIGGITNDEVTAAYNNMVNAQALCSNGTATDLKAALDALKTSYETLNAKKGTVLNGVYHINFDGANVFVAHTAAIGGLTGAGEGYKLFDAKVDNSDSSDTSGSTAGTTTNEGYKELQNNVITAMDPADALFTIVPNGDASGYTISAQGLYLHNTSSWYSVLSLSGDVAQAGVYLVEESAVAGLYKLKSNRNDIQYINDWGPVFGNDKSTKETGLSIFSFNPVTEYTITVPESGYLPLCLPFHVVLPEGVEAYDINNVEKQVLVTGEGLLQQLAVAGDIVQAGTPMIVKGTAGNYTLTITMDREDAKTSLEGSVLCGNYVKQSLAVDNARKKYVLNGKVWAKVEEPRELPANSCWIDVDAAAIDYDYAIDLDPDFVEIDEWKFRYEPMTNGVKLTDAAVSGDGELVIPSEVSINNETKDVVAISGTFLHGNETLTSVTLPATLVNLGFRDLEHMFDGSYEGEPGDGGVYEKEVEISQVGAHRYYGFPIDPVTTDTFVVKSEFAWRLTLDVTIDSDTINFNNYGSAIVSTNKNSLLNSYTDGDMQIYMREGHQEIIVKIDNADDRYTYTLPVLDANGKETGELVTHKHFKFELEHDGSGGYQVVIYYDDNRAKMYSISASEGAKVKDFKGLYYSLPEGIHVKVKVEKLISHGLFVDCTNLKEIKVHEDNPTFMGCDHGVLYDKNQYYVMRIPEAGGEEKGGRRHFSIPSKVVKLYPGAIHGVDADVVLHSNPQIALLSDHEDEEIKTQFYLSLDDMDPDSTVKGARDFISTNHNTYVSANYKRAPLAEGKYGTIVLPFVATNWKNKYDFFEMTAADATSFHFSPVDELEIQKPYLYKLKDGVEPDDNTKMKMEMEVEGDTLDVFEGGGFTVETLAKYNPNDEKPGDFRALGAYVNHYIETKNYKNSAYYYFNIDSQKFIKVTKKLNYRPYRAIFVVTPEKEGEAAKAPARLGLRIGGTTEIDPSQVDGLEEPIYYDLQGRRVENPTQGIYIVNGKKVIVK